MKNRSGFLWVLILTTLVQPAFGQFKFGIKAGMGSQNISYSDLIVTSSEAFQDLKIGVQNAELGLHFGVMAQINLGTFFIQPEILLNSNSVDYQVDDFNGSFVDDVFKERYQYLDIPVIMGARLGPIRIGAGPVGHVFVNSSSDLFRFNEYNQNFDKMKFGWQGGLGVDLWRLHIDIRYEGNFSNFGDHIEWQGNTYEFAESPSRVLASVGISF